MIIVICIYSIVQAVTEFLPVSSSGHLVLLHSYLPLRGVDALRFDVALHWGTLIAVLVAFWPDIKGLIRGGLRTLRERSIQGNPSGKLAWMLVASTVIPALVALAAGDAIEERLREPAVVACMLAIGGVALIIADKLGARTQAISQLSFAKALLIGASQAIALIPGVSRSGMTIIAGLGVGLTREAAVRFSFLLSVPIILAAGVKEMPTLFSGSISNTEWAALGVGIAVSAIVGYWVIKFFLRFVTTNSFMPFAVYRFALAAVLTILLLV